MSQKQRPALSQSLSFPAKTNRVASLKKSMDANEIKGEVSVRPRIKSTKNPDSSSKEVQTKTESSKVRASLASKPSFKRSVVKILFHFYSLLFVCDLHSFLGLVSLYLTSVLCTSLEGLLR